VAAGHEEDGEEEEGDVEFEDDVGVERDVGEEEENDNAPQAAVQHQQHHHHAEAQASRGPQRQRWPQGLAAASGASTADAGGDANWTVDNPSLDLESYAQGYRGLARLFRLHFIAQHCPQLRLEALKMAVTQVQQQTHNTQMYVKLHKEMLEATAAAGPASRGASNLPDLAAGTSRVH